MRSEEAILVERKDGTKMLAKRDSTFHSFVFASGLVAEEGGAAKIAYSDVPYMTFTTINDTETYIPFENVSQWGNVLYYRLKEEYIVRSPNGKIKIHIPLHL